MSESSARLDEQSTAVQAHVNILQQIIGRLSASSANCKAWCVAIASALLVLAADKGLPILVAVSLLPSFMFLILDAYYLSLERGFRHAHDEFVRKLHAGQLKLEDLFLMKPSGDVWNHRGWALLSISVWPFYTTLFLITLIVLSLMPKT